MPQWSAAKEAERPASESLRAPQGEQPEPLVRGRLVVYAEPWGNVWIDGKPVGRSPFRERLKPGLYTVQVGDTYPEAPKRVRISLGQDPRSLDPTGGAPVSGSPKYEIGALLGKGGMAETFEATRIKENGPGFRVALKQVLPELLGHSPAMREEFLARFAREARIGATLDHPNIVRVVDSGVLDGRPYMAMQLIQGCSLAALIESCAERGTPLPPTVLTHIACDLGAALEYAHRHDVLHRDVTPGNVLAERRRTMPAQRLRSRAARDRGLGAHANQGLHGQSSVCGARDLSWDGG